MPPLSDKLTVTVADPFASVAGVKVRFPDELIAGWLLNSELVLLLTVNVTL